MSKKPPEQAAGGLVWRRTPDKSIEILLAHRPRYDDWAFPKGKLDPGESLIECALREVDEETGFRCRAGRYLGVTTFAKPSGRPKVVAYWAMEIIDGGFEVNDEIDDIRWVRLDDLKAHLSYDVDENFAAALDIEWTKPADRILLTRHAHAGDRYRWDGDDELRPLSGKGTSEASALVGQLSPFSIDRILSSHARRCIETVMPTASDRALELETHPDLWEAASDDGVQALIAASHSGTTLLSTHGPNVATALHTLTGESVGVPMEKGSTWVLDFAADELVAANYLHPPR